MMWDAMTLMSHHWNAPEKLYSSKTTPHVRWYGKQINFVKAMTNLVSWQLSVFRESVRMIKWKPWVRLTPSSNTCKMKAFWNVFCLILDRVLSNVIQTGKMKILWWNLHVAWDYILHFLSCHQAALWMVQSVHPPHFFHYDLLIVMKFIRVITIDVCDVHAKGQGQR